MIPADSIYIMVLENTIHNVPSKDWHFLGKKKKATKRLKRIDSQEWCKDYFELCATQDIQQIKETLNFLEMNFVLLER